MNRNCNPIEMRKIFFLFVLLCMAYAAKAQLKTYLTVEAGPQWSLIKVGDPGDYFESANVKSSMAGITIGQELIPNLSVVTGVYYQPYVDGINMDDKRPDQSRWTSYTAVLIPLRAEYRVQYSEFPVSFTPRMGYVYGKISQPEIFYQSSGVLSAPDGTALSYNLSHNYDAESLHMLEVGIGMNLRFYGAWQASFNLSYMTGFTEPLSSTLNYTDQGGNTKTATYSSKGNTLYTTLAFNIPVSNIWQLRDYRLRSRIENSVYDGKSIDRRGKIYFGGELGSLWRKFNITNPAIGARPLDGRGLFRYANLHTGIYAGYMLTNDLGVDIGVNYQSSSTFYALMYDHEVDYVIKTTAPMFLEFPVRIRYFYNVYKEKIHYVVYGGASLLTNFTTGIYNQGGGDFSYVSPQNGAPVNATTSYDASRSSKLIPIMRIGTGVEYSLPTEFPLIATLYVNYMHGFASTDEIHISNSVGESPSLSTVSYNGSGWSLDLGIKVPFRFGKGSRAVRTPDRNEKP